MVNEMKIIVLNTIQPKVERLWGNEATVLNLVSILRSMELSANLYSVNNSNDIAKILSNESPDLVIPNGYKLLGEEGQPPIMKILSQMDVPYLGSDSDLMDDLVSKVKMKEQLSKNGIQNPKSFILSQDYLLSNLNGLKFPLITKLEEGAESIGMKKINSIEELKSHADFLFKEYGQRVVVEEYVRNKEYTIAVLGNGSKRHILPIQVILPNGFDYLSSEIKERHVMDTVGYVYSEKKRNQIEKLVNQICDSLNIKDWVRMEILEDSQGSFYTIDINPLPGLRNSETHPSYYPICTKLNLGLNYNQTIAALVYEASLRNGLKIPNKFEDNLQSYIEPIRGVKN